MATAATAQRGAFKVSTYYTPFPKQAAFHRSPAKYRLFGGSAGPGKSKALLWEAISQVLEQYPAPLDTLLLRRTFPELEQSLINQFRRDVPRDLYASYNDSKHVVTFHNGSTLRFGYCLSDKDVYQYQGAEYLFIGVDELTQFSLASWQFLTSRNRCPVPGTFANMAGATNPGGRGHTWVKSLWVLKKPAVGMERPEEYDPRNYDFIPALLQDNPIYANDPNYLASLEALPRAMRQAYLLGDWDLFAGQYFDILNADEHVARGPARMYEGAEFVLHAGMHNEERIKPEAWWTRWASMDWGFADDAACYWHMLLPDGRVVTYREFVQASLTPRMLGQAIREKSVYYDQSQTERPERISQVYLSPDAFGRKTSESTIAAELGDVLAQGDRLPRPAPADDERVGGWMLMYQLLESRQWIISNQCPKLLECLAALTRDEDYREDCLAVEGDDPADAARYGLKSRLAPAQKPLEVRVAERMTAADPTVRAIQAKRALIDEQKRSLPVKGRGASRWRPGWKPKGAP